MTSVLPSPEFWRHRSVLVTGHTGFKGSWLCLWLSRLGARVSGYSLEPPTIPSNFEVAGVRAALADHRIGDVRDLVTMRRAIDAAEPEVVFHLGAQPLVRAALREPRETFEVNVIGTVNVMEALRMRGAPCAAVLTTSDKVYAPLSGEGKRRHTESDPLGGFEVYGASKAAAELAIGAYRAAYFSASGRGPVKVASVRAGNVIGGGDWAPDRLLPDVARAFSIGSPVTVRHPDAVRPWQHVLEPLSGYMVLAERLAGSGDATRLPGAFNFGPDESSEVTVEVVVETAIETWGAGSWIADGVAAGRSHGTSGASGGPEAGHDIEAPVLRLDSSLASEELGWRPVWGYREAVGRTVAWYRRFYSDPDEPVRDACLADLAAYEEAAQGSGNA